MLTTEVVEKDLSKHKGPHFACGSLSEDESAIVVSTPLPNVPVPLKKPVNDSVNNPKSNQPLSVSIKPAKILTSDDQPLVHCMDLGSDETMHRAR
ncbi:hypothetical protein OIU77_029640 [Salix suchowensis]|uniref:Uncharacterized protein n=1 Tax=Salix suchowensis TaxID=1278906 RepID=A0ABQ9B9Y3_9ROSI|nr:hypothetical protein OIU77_029640 [Salix suchowensis]